MEDRTIDLSVVSEIAQALGNLNKSVVFVGGAVVSTYADDPAADEIRPTQDVDLTLKPLNYDQQALDEKLAELGFHPDLQGHTICTYKYVRYRRGYHALNRYHARTDESLVFDRL